ncbi:transposase [Gemmata sp. G18]|uniref:Transposase n=1 Tax=Gemmata palustris TaxID=2822762 RepID=A0ABS5BVM5_9BACT|nr:transposase [Gemmata palustris]
MYLPEAWTGERDRMTQAGIPGTVGHQPKWQMALDMVGRAATTDPQVVSPVPCSYSS